MSLRRVKQPCGIAKNGPGHVQPDLRRHGIRGSDGRLLQGNRKLCEILGYSEEELKTLTFRDLTYPDDMATSSEHFEFLVSGKLKNYTLEKRYIRKDGSIVWVNLSVSAVAVAGTSHFISVVEDITERKQADQKIADLNADLAAHASELEAANRELEAFSYSVTHDLRKPLTVINGYCQLIMDMCLGSLGEQCKGYLEEIYTGTLRMNDLIDALLKFSLLARKELRREEVDLSAVAKSTTAELRLAEPDRRVTLKIAEGIKVDGDAGLLRVALDNLIGNAWKYTHDREDAIIEFGAAAVEGKQACFVRDNGLGFHPADAEKIFVPFQRLPGADKYKGHGIGLATVQRIIQRHGGRIWAEGAPEKGSTFYFTLT